MRGKYICPNRPELTENKNNSNSLVGRLINVTENVKRICILHEDIQFRLHDLNTVLLLVDNNASTNNCYIRLVAGERKQNFLTISFLDGES